MALLLGIGSEQGLGFRHATNAGLHHPPIVLHLLLSLPLSLSLSLMLRSLGTALTSF